MKSPHASLKPILFFMLLLVLTLPNQSYAQISESSNYSIELQDITTELPAPTPKLPMMRSIPMQSARNAQQLNTSNYSVISSSDAFALTLSQLIIDFGPLSPTNPVIRTSQIQLASPLQGAIVLGSEDRPMTATDKQFVPDTSCDNGLCTAAIASSWESALTYGFGYRCESGDVGSCDQAFKNPGAYKQFASTRAGDDLEQVMQSSNPYKPTTAKIIYKVNISGTQPLGGYRNTITYIAIPNF